MIRLLIVDDELTVRKGLQMCLSAHTDLSVVGEAMEGRAAIELAKSLCPDVVLLDVEMPGMDGIATAKGLHKTCPNIAIIMLSIHDDVSTRKLALDAGAAAFVAKCMPTNLLLMTIRQVALTASHALGSS